MGKLVEEVGELAVELQIAQGRLPQEKGGKDGVMGECVDVINTVLDIAFLHQCQVEGKLVDPYKIEQMMLSISGVKLERWQKKLQAIESMQ
jgi:NTP pyrophosphatase (non-canonical NTP hydrolase)